MGRKTKAKVAEVKRLNVWLPGEMVRDAKVEAARSGMTLAELVARAVERQVDELRRGGRR